MKEVNSKISRRTESSFLEHLRSLRRTFLFSFSAAAAGFCVCFFFFETIIVFLYKPFLTGQNISDLSNSLFIGTVLEGFSTKIRVSLLGGVILALPVIVFLIIRFVFPALYPREKRVILLSLAVCSLLAAGGFYYGYKLILPPVFSFLTGRGFIPQDVGVLLNYSATVFFVFQFVFIMTLVFQFPVVFSILLFLGLVSRKRLFGSAKFVIVGIFILSAIITPPDVVSQIAVAVPLVVLFFISLALAWLFKWGE